MKRIAIALGAALLGTACGSSHPPPTGAVDMAWAFIRYDATGAPIATYTCAQAGIDNVIVSFQFDGDVQVPCSDAAGDGALIGGIGTGTQNVYVTGRRGGHALYQSQTFTITVAQNQNTSGSVIQVLGIPDNLYVYANFLDQFGANAGWTTCTAAFGPAGGTLDYVIADWANTTVASGTVTCTDPAGVSFVGSDALDRDQYVIRMRGFPSGSSVETFDSATTAVTPHCDGQAFNHYGPNDNWDVALFDVSHNALLCP